jgi:hypothetical protein
MNRTRDLASCSIVTQTTTQRLLLSSQPQMHISTNFHQTLQSLAYRQFSLRIRETPGFEPPRDSDYPDSHYNYLHFEQGQFLNLTEILLVVLLSLRPPTRHYQKKKVVGLEQGPLSLVSTTEELLDRKVAAV